MRTPFYDIGVRLDRPLRYEKNEKTAVDPRGERNPAQVMAYGRRISSEVYDLLELEDQ